jgi:hypothetical protein
MRTIFIFVLSVLLLNSCQNESKNLLDITGKSGEILIVLDKPKWDSSIGEKFRSILENENLILPQPETMFDLSCVSNSTFDGVLQRFRNIILVNFKSDAPKTVIALKNDVWAKDQLVLEIVATDEQSLLNVLDENKSKLISYFNDVEKKRITDNYNKFKDNSIIDKIKKKHNINITIPKGYTLDLDSSNFLWISHETPAISQGILIYYYNYSDTSNFSKSSLITVRDSILKKYVSGPTPESYMTTEKEFEIIQNKFLYNNNFCSEIKGLWKLEGDYMGGPFTSLSILDKSRNRIVTVEGYVYAPKEDKREYVRQLESILYSVGF